MSATSTSTKKLVVGLALVTVCRLAQNNLQEAFVAVCSSQILPLQNMAKENIETARMQISNIKLAMSQLAVIASDEKSALGQAISCTNFAAYTPTERIHWAVWEEFAKNVQDALVNGESPCAYMKTIVLACTELLITIDRVLEETPITLEKVRYLQERCEEILHELNLNYEFFQAIELSVH